ncbi:hypothetical protein PQX77_008077 [Marasmius sp. AFHP31]|nr:hypothetical protein PQX77_008077 [Marasmius sp. AFHP31]
MEISRIIVKRMKSKEKVYTRINTLNEYRDMARRERQFEEGLLGKSRDRENIWSGEAFAEWVTPMAETTQALRAGQRAQLERFLGPYPPGLLAQVAQARRTKWENKTREKERERRGEVLKSTRRRQRKGLPAHLLSKLSKDQIEKELTVRRSIAEVGYVGQLKRDKGWKVRTPKKGGNPGETWSIIDGAWTSDDKESELKQGVQEMKADIRSRQRSSMEKTDT